MSKVRTGSYRLLIGADVRKKNLLKLQALVYFLCFLFLCSMNTWLPNVKNIRQTEAVELYGSWHYGLFSAAEPCLDLIERNALLEDTARLVTYGSVYDEGGRNMGRIGTMEEAARPLCRIELLEGRMPEAPDEIALEQASLDRLGYSYELGQEITFVTGAVGLSMEEAAGGKRVTYTLCGVLESYSILITQTDGLPAAIVSEEGAALLEGDKSQGILFQVKEECDAVLVQRELAAALLSGGYMDSVNWVDNFYVYGTDFIQENAGWLQLMIIATGLVMVFGLSVSYILRERKRIGILETLGMTRWEIGKLLFMEQLLIWLTAMVMGFLTGTMAVFGFLRFYVEKQRLETAILYPARELAVVCGGGSLVLLSGILLGFLLAGRGSASRRLKGANCSLLEKRKLQPIKKPVGISLMGRELRVRKGSYLGLFLLETVMFFLTAVCIGGMYWNYEYYKLETMYYICDYTVGGMPDSRYMGREVKGCMNEKLLDRIRQVDGVEKVETVYWNPGVEVLEEEIREGAYYKATEAYYLENEGEFEIPLLCIEDDGKILDSLKDSINVGEWNQDKIDAGEEAVIYLPLQRYFSESLIGLPYVVYLQKQEAYDAEYANWMERNIKIGDTVSISIGGKQQEVKIGGIIYDCLREKGKLSAVPYSIYCGKALFEEWTKETAENNHSMTIISAGSQADYLYADKRIAQLVNEEGLVFQNIRGEMLQKVKYRKMSVLFLFLTLLIIGLLHICMIKNFYQREREKGAKSRETLYYLGAKKRQVQDIFIIPHMCCMLAGAVVSFVGFIVFYYKLDAGMRDSYSLKPMILVVGRDTLANLVVLLQFIFIAITAMTERKKL